MKAHWALLELSLLGALACGSGGGAEAPPPDPGEVGPFGIGHVNYVSTDGLRADRPVAISVWYPAARSTSTPPARYPFDAFDPSRGASTSAEWEPRGYDRANEQPTPAKGGPFPLLVFSTGSGMNYWDYLFVGTRLASHGFVVAVTEHHGEGQLPWSPHETVLHQVVHRVRDIPFALSVLLEKNGASAELLYATIDPSRIAMGGHSLGGYTTYALAGGDDSACDTRVPYTDWNEPWPYPAETCVSALPDGRIRAIISLDGSSVLLHYAELARISLPSLIMGQTIGLGSRNARPHAAIGRADSYRVDVNGAIHLSFSNWCDSILVAVDTGLLTPAEGTALRQQVGCDAALAQGVSNQVIAKYLLAFLDTHLGGAGAYRSILTPSYASTHQPTVQFFSSERCQATLPDDSYFTFIGWQELGDCRVEIKDPPGNFIP